MSREREHKKIEVSYKDIRDLSSRSDAMVHFIGVGGVSMYSLAYLTIVRGAMVSGSDRERSIRTDKLTCLGARINIGHTAENVNGASLVVYSHAIAEDNPELCEARAKSIPIISRADYLGAVMIDYDSRIGVCGSHGKSTTVAMLDSVFSHAGLRPTTLSGSVLPIGEPIRLGDSGTLIYESCEYKDSFLRFSPTISIALNLELDHTDYFADIGAICNSFIRALSRAEGFALINGDDENLSSILKEIKEPVITFGFGETNDYHYRITKFRPIGYDFTVYRHDEFVENFELNIPGEFNVKNATAVIGVAIEMGIDPIVIKEALASYHGIQGRLEHIGSRYGRPVYYDYAHHPTEIACTINALRQVEHRPITVVFKPHTYSRTAALWDDFARSLSMADRLVVTDIYPAREQPIVGITSENLASEINGARYCPDNKIAEVIDFTDGAIILMGAGNFDKIIKDIVRN